MSHIYPRIFAVVGLLGITLLGVAVAAQPAQKDSAGLPAELQGVWRIVSGEEDGKQMRFARGDDVEIGECVCNEIIIQRDRWIIVNNFGDALVFRAKVVATEPNKRIHIWGDRAFTEREGPKDVYYRLTADELSLCSRKDGKAPEEFTAKKGSGQAMLVLKREK